MIIDKNDPRLTAFVLGELADDETKEVQAALDADAELRTEVEAIRKTVAEIEDFMKTEPVPGETKVSTPGVIDTPEKAEEIKKRRFPLTIVELLVVVSIIGMLAGMLMPAKNAARNSARYLTRQLESFDAEVPATESTPIDGSLRYFGKEPEDIHIFEEDAPVEMRLEAIAADAELRELDGKMRQEFARSLPEQSKMDEAPKMEVATADLGDMMAPDALMSSMGELSGQDLSGRKNRGTAVVSGGKSERQSGLAAGRRPARGMGSMDGEPFSGPTLGAKSVPVPVSPYQQPGMETGESITMMVTPKVIVQEEKEESLTGIRDAEGKPVQLGRPEPKSEPVIVAGTSVMDKVVIGLESRHDPYNSASDEAYKNFVENDFLRPQKAPFSTFSIDVDTAAYTTMRRYINQGQRPPAASVRLEEYVNFFKYDYAQSTDGKPFATHVDVASCPWEPKHLLARIGIKGKEYTVDERPPLNLVFLIDTSGSMSSSNRLPLVQRGLTELVEMLQPKDRVAIVTYAGSSKLALPSVSGQEKQAILDSINSLNAGGSTAGAAGIKTAYATARKYYNKNAQNRVILCTDGDFNVGTTDNKTLEQMIGEEAKSGVFLTILGFGMGNYKDERLKTLSMRGNGNYGYVDTIEEARRLLVEGLTGTLFAIAKDVKIQVDFNPSRVAAYRLLGYENRKLRDEDFHNDKIDAGEIGAGHTVTALYEIVPVGGTVPSKVDESRYAEKPAAEKPGSSADAAHPAHEGELMFVKLRYKLPDGDKSSLLEYPVVYNADAELSGDAEFAAAAALYGMLLRQSRYSGAGSFDGVLELAEPNVKDDPYRKEFVELVRKAKELR